MRKPATKLRLATVTVRPLVEAEMRDAAGGGEVVLSRQNRYCVVPSPM